MSQGTTTTTATESDAATVDNLDIGFGDILPDQWAAHLGLIVSLLVIASPLLLVFFMSTQTVSEVYNLHDLFVGSAGVSNYVQAMTTYGMGRYMLNSLVMATVVTVGKIVVSLLAALALVYYRFRFKRAVFLLILFTLMFPVPVRIVPLFQLMATLGWSNSLLAITGPYLASATGVFLLRQHFQSIPVSLVESARLDGVGPFTFLRKVLVPMSKGMLTGLGVIEFIYAWNQYLWPLIVISAQNKQVVQVGMKYLQSAGSAGQTDWGLVMAGAMLTLVVPLVVLVAFRKPLLETFGVQD